MTDESIERTESALSDEEIRRLPKRAYRQDPVAILRTVFAPCRPEARVAFGSRRPDKAGAINPHWLAHISIGELLSKRDRKVDRIFKYRPQETQYVVFNPLQFNARWIREQGFPETGELKYFPVKKENVTQVRALFADLDVGRAESEHSEMKPEHALGALIVASDRWGVPPASLIGISGRGAYVVWLLQPRDVLWSADSDPVVKKWDRAEKQLVSRLRNLGSDENAARIMNWLKRPGTRDTLTADGKETKTGRTVDYYTLVPDLEKVAVYDLDEILEATRIEQAPRPKAATEKVRITRHPDGTVTVAPIPFSQPVAPTARRLTKRAPRPMDGSQPAARRVADLLKLNEARGGIREGMRAKFIFYLTVAATELSLRRHRSLKVAEKEAWETAKKANRLFRPVLPNAELREHVRSVVAEKRRGKRYMVSNGAVARALKVTDEEARRLKLVSVAPEAVRKARRAALEDRKRARQEVWETVARMHREGKSTATIVKVTDLSRTTVKRQRARIRDIERMRGRGANAQSH